MAEKSIDELRREYFDRSYPLIEQNTEAPGRWQPYEDGRPGQKWTGKSRWSIKHGESIVRWDRGEPFFVSDANLTDGTKIDIHWWIGNGWRYQVSRIPRCWVHGVIDIRPDGVTFTPGEQPKYTAPNPSDHPSLYVDMAGDSALRERLLDEDFADSVYGYLKNQGFFKEGGERIWSNGLSGNAGFIANLRGQGDVYTDYYPHGGRLPLSELTHATRTNPQLTPEEAGHAAALEARFAEIKTILARLGWRLATAEDGNVATAATRRDLAAWEARPESIAPDWVAKIQAPRPPPPGAIRLMKMHPNQMTEAERARDREIATDALPKRLDSLATSGRISETEYHEMVGRIARIP